MGDVPELEPRRRLVSSVVFTLKDLIQGNQKTKKRDFDLMKHDDLKVKVARLLILRCLYLDRFTFLDYIYAGCEISTLIGVDFTMSNKAPKDKTSLHHIHPKLKPLYAK